jgi:GT2 family glycosyltransferase/glycosyltransferase involved in cell wall biosynthesis
MTPPVAVAIVSWNTAGLLDACLASLRADQDAGRAEVWVVDNASSDGSPTLVRERHPWVRLLALQENAGFGPAVNLVAARTRTPWLAAANADLAFAPDALAALLAAGAAHPEAGAFAPRLLLPDGSTQHSVHPFPTVRLGLALSSGLARRAPVARRLPLEGHWDPERARAVDWAHGALLLVRRTAWDAAGGFDPEQWLWAEDLDLCWRLRRLGWRTRYVPQARVEHAASAAVGARWSADERALRTQRSAYAWLLARRGVVGTRAVALAHLAGPTVRTRALGAGARIAPGRRAAAAARERGWVAMHRTGLEPRAALVAHRRGEERGGAPLGSGATPAPVPGRRLGVLLDHFPELTETFVAAELHALQALGAHVAVEAAAAAAHPDPAAGAGLGVRYAADDDRLTRLRALAWLWRRAPGACLRDLFDRARWQQDEWPVSLRVLAPTARRLRGAGVEHLHAHFGAGAALSALRLGRLLALPTSVTLHGYDIFSHPRNLAEKLERAAFATSGSRFTVDHLRAEHGAAAARTHVVVMGVDTERWRRATPAPARGPVLAIGRLVEKKGFADLIRAAALLRDEPAFTGVVIVGDGALREALGTLVQELALGDVVELRGALAPPAVRALLEQAAVVAIPSVVAADGDADSMPLVAKEALAMEVPVVATTTAGLPEIVRPPWGRTVAPGDPAALAAALGEVLALDAAARGGAGAAGRAHVVAAASVSAETARLLGLVDAAVAAHAGRDAGTSARRGRG